MNIDKHGYHPGSISTTRYQEQQSSMEVKPQPCFQNLRGIFCKAPPPRRCWSGNCATSSVLFREVSHLDGGGLQCSLSWCGRCDRTPVIRALTGQNSDLGQVGFPGHCFQISWTKPCRNLASRSWIASSHFLEALLALKQNNFAKFHCQISSAFYCSNTGASKLVLRNLLQPILQVAPFFDWLTCLWGWMIARNSSLFPHSGPVAKTALFSAWWNVELNLIKHAYCWNKVESLY